VGAVEEVLTEDVSPVRHVEADADMIKELKNITNPTCKERIERGIAVMCLSVKRFFVLAWIRLDNLISNTNN